MQYIKNILTALTMFAIATLSLPTSVFAATTFNNDPLDRATLRVKNADGNNQNWGTTISPVPGQAISFAIYYHNTGTETAQNVRVRITPQSAASGVTTFSATVSANNAPSVGGTVSVTVPQGESLSFIPGTVKHYPNQTTSNGINLPNETNIFSGAGISLGNIAPGWSTQGSVVLDFRVSQANNATCTLVASTQNAFNITQNSATLSGSVNAQNCTNGTAYFQYGIGTPNLTTNAVSFSNSQSVSQFVGNLSPNTTYVYRLVAQANGQTVQGNQLSFTTPADSCATNPSLCQQQCQATATTTNATNVFDTSATLNGIVSLSNCGTATAFFQYGQGSSLNLTTQSFSVGNNQTVQTGVFGLIPNTQYSYRLMIQTSNGSFQGSQVFFNTTGNNNTSCSVSATTGSVSSISDTSAFLGGSIGMTSGCSGTYFFRYGAGSLTSQTNTLFFSNSQSVSQLVSGLLPNTTYIYQLVAQSTNGQVAVGQTLQFVTTGFNNNPCVINPSLCNQPTQNQAPLAVTSVATTVTQSSAFLNGIVSIFGNVPTTGYFEYGLGSSSLTNVSASQSVGSSGTLTFASPISNLQANRLYFYRAVAQNAFGITKGDILTFRTNSIPVVVEPPVITVPPTIIVTPTLPARDLSIMKEVRNLDTENGSTIAVQAERGDTLKFTIRVTNTGRDTMNDLTISDVIPPFLRFANATSTVDVNTVQREVTWRVGALLPGQSTSVDLDVIVNDDAPFTTLKNIARVEATNFSRSSNEVAINVVSEINLLGASVFGGFGNFGFFPNSLIEWLLLILIIMALVYLGRKLFVKDNVVVIEGTTPSNLPR